MGFNKRNIKRGNNTIGRGMPVVISFGVGLIPDEGAMKRAHLDFRGISLKKDVAKSGTKSSLCFPKREPRTMKKVNHPYT